VVRREPLGYRVRRGRAEYLAHPVRLEVLEHLENLERLVRLVRLGQAGYLENPALLAQAVCLVLARHLAESLETRTV